MSSRPPEEKPEKRAAPRPDQRSALRGRATCPLLVENLNLTTVPLRGRRRQFLRQCVEFRRKGVSPVRSRNPKNIMQTGKIKPRVMWTGRAGGIVGAGDRQNMFDRKHDVSLFEPFDNRRCKAMPAGLARRHEIDEPVGFAAARTELIEPPRTAF